MLPGQQYYDSYKGFVLENRPFKIIEGTGKDLEGRFGGPALLKHCLKWTNGSMYRCPGAGMKPGRQESEEVYGKLLLVYSYYFCEVSAKLYLWAWATPGQEDIWTWSGKQNKLEPTGWIPLCVSFTISGLQTFRGK